MTLKKEIASSVLEGARPILSAFQEYNPGFKLEGFYDRNVQSNNFFAYYTCINDSQFSILDDVLHAKLVLSLNHERKSGVAAGLLIENKNNNNVFTQLKVVDTRTVMNVETQEGLHIVIDQTVKVYKLLFDELQSLVPLLAQRFEKNALKQLLQLLLVTRSIDQLSSRKLRVASDIVASVRLMEAVYGNSKWALLNGVLHYTTHVWKQNRSQIYGNPINAPARLNCKAYSFCTKNRLALLL